MTNSDDEIRTIVLRYQKVLANMKKKINQLMQIKKKFIEETIQNTEVHHSHEEDEEDGQLLQNMKLEV
jgi:hypothetical protein